MENNKHYKARVLAYYLPQFHPIPENDVWWGKGFTEWTNVGKAKPLYWGHYQPHVPADLGYYDLRVPEARKAQADLAREYGVEGFVYWHYWFGNGKRLLERPFSEVLKSGSPDFPFALAWANESWQGLQHGLNSQREILIEQKYPGEEDYINHFFSLLPAFKDKRYITCEDKPIFIIFKHKQIPDIKNFISTWQECAKANGLPGIFFIAYITGVLEKHEDELESCKSEGFDAINIVNLFGPLSNQPFLWHVNRSLFHKHYRFRLIPDIRKYDASAFGSSIDHREDVFPSVIPNWDNTPRCGLRGTILEESTPHAFGLAVKDAVKRIESKTPEKKFIFIKSWNEWAEGNYMEPDMKWGKSYLEELRDSIL